MNNLLPNQNFIVHIFCKKIRYMAKAYQAIERWMWRTLASMRKTVDSTSKLHALNEQILRYVPVTRMAGGRMAARARAKATSKAKAKAPAQRLLPIADYCH